MAWRKKIGSCARSTAARSSDWRIGLPAQDSAAPAKSTPARMGKSSSEARRVSIPPYEQPATRRERSISANIQAQDAFLVVAPATVRIELRRADLEERRHRR